MWELPVMGVQFEELTRKDLPLCLVKVYCNVGRGLLTLSRVGNDTAEVNIPTPPERQFQWCYELHNYTDESRVCVPKDNGKPATKFDSSHLHIIDCNVDGQSVAR
jgi:hypothetical protein